MLSQSRNVEQWANSSLFIHEIIRAMQHQSKYVRHSALQIVRRMRHALALSETIKPAFVSYLNTTAPSYQSDPGHILCCLQIIYTFAPHHHDSTWVVDFLQSDSNKRLQPECPKYSVYLLAMMEIVEGNDMNFDLRDTFNQNLRSWHLCYAWRVLAALEAQELTSDELDEVLPNLITFTMRYQRNYGSVRSEIFDCPDLLLLDLKKNRPESPSIPSLQDMISSLAPYK
ncbi:hypothetical protein BJ138DRAFT_1113039 [Hygrophoropsis aurantiaca]|uniref:Uncharacterized protein n=1 Tax=Hygrophoropsis aurantiaca TaxID=72124 RepID=A0ACB8AFE7_9AGAM|nr:hypothetical protein BJ138DRAFT_1113039 [Hygrophoropsis aurantiaca]